MVMSDKELLTPYWDSDTEKLAYEIEEALLKVLNDHYHGIVEPTDSIEALALATGHYVQSIEQILGNKVDLFSDFQKWVDNAHSYYVQNPSSDDNLN